MFRVLCHPSSDHGVVLPCAEVIPTENFIPQCSILQLFSAEKLIFARRVINIAKNGVQW